jgi:hypothetical protein
MNQNSKHAGNVLLIRGATLWLLVALILAWCLVFLKADISLLKMIFPGKFIRVLQAHLDFLIMSALLFGFYAAKVTLPWHVRWAMVVGAFTNSSLFLMQALFPVLDGPIPAEGFFPAAFRVFLMISIVITTYEFGRGAVIIFLSTFERSSSD